MKWIIKILLLFYLTGCQEATITPWLPPIPKPTEKDSVWGDYFPNKPGTEWVYNLIFENQLMGTVKIHIQKRVLIKNNLSVSLWQYDEPGKSYFEYVGILQDSVLFFTDIGDLSNSKNIYKNYVLSLDIFRNWNVRNLEQSFGSDRSSGGTKIDTLTVAVGKFDNVFEIEHITDTEDKNAHEFISFVPGIGMIKRITLDNKKNETTILELKSYKIAK